MIPSTVRPSPGRIAVLLACLIAAAVGSAAQEPEPVLGKPSAIEPPAAAEVLVSVDAGARLREQPHPWAPILEVIEIPVRLPLLEQRGAWVKVRYGSWLGWLVPSGPEPATAPEPGGARLLDDRRLLRLRELLGTTSELEPFGSFALYTDVTDRALLQALRAVAEGLTTSYHERYGLDAGGGMGETVVLMSREADYRRFESAEPAIVGSDSGGYSGFGLSVLFVGERRLDQLAAVLVHELTHLLNRRALGEQVPAWLEEGMAEDLAFSRMDEAGRLQLGTLGGTPYRRLGRPGLTGVPRAFELVGPRGSLSGLLFAWDEPLRPPLAALVELSRDEFVRTERRAFLYAESAFLIRYLLDGGKATLKSGFRAYVRSVAELGELSGPSLWSHLKREPARIERGFYGWLWNQATANGLPVPERGRARQ